MCETELGAAELSQSKSMSSQNKARLNYRISSYNTRGYYSFSGPSTAGIIRTLFNSFQTSAIDNFFLKSSNIARGDISRAGIIKHSLALLRALLECGYYSREGLI